MKAHLQSFFFKIETKLKHYHIRKYTRMFFGGTILLFLIKNPPSEVYDLEIKPHSFLVSNHIEARLASFAKDEVTDFIDEDIPDDHNHLLYGDEITVSTPPKSIPAKNIIVEKKPTINKNVGSDINYQFSNIYHNVKAGKRNAKIENFIETYKYLAIQEARKYGHNAAIKMAQAILESKYGTSNFYNKTGNMFCIKKKVQSSNPKSPYYKPDYFITAEKELTSGIKQHTDDAPNEDFYSFNRPWNAWRFHSLFLKWRIEKHPNYKPLQSVDRRDYTAWAKYLDSYATDGSYGKNLIRMIRTYDLQELDNF